MRIVACLGLVAFCLGLVGCTSFGKKASSPTAVNQPTADRGLARPGDRIGAQSTDGPVPSAGLNGILAGQIVDSYNHRPPTTFVQVTEARDGGAPASAPIEVAADSQGYFTIQGLQPGKHYLLTARARNGDHVMAGSSWPRPRIPRF